MKRLYFILVLWIGKFGNVLCKIFHKSGTMISGKVAVKLQKNFVKYFRNKSDYTLDELLLASKDIFKEIFY